MSVFLHVTVRVNRGKVPEWSSTFEKEYLPLCEKYGQKLVAVWATTIGVYDEITDVYRFESMAEMERVRAALFADPKVQELIPRITPLSGFEISKLMVPMPYSPLK